MWLERDGIHVRQWKSKKTTNDNSIISEATISLETRRQTNRRKASLKREKEKREKKLKQKTKSVPDTTNLKSKSNPTYD